MSSCNSLPETSDSVWQQWEGIFIFHSKEGKSCLLTCTDLHTISQALIPGDYLMNTLAFHLFIYVCCKHSCTIQSHYYNPSEQIYKYINIYKYLNGTAASRRKELVHKDLPICLRGSLPSVWYPQYLDLTSVLGKHSSPIPGHLPTLLTFSLPWDVWYFLLDNALGYFLNWALKLIRVIFFPSVFPTYC